MPLSGVWRGNCDIRRPHVRDDSDVRSRCAGSDGGGTGCAATGLGGRALRWLSQGEAAEFEVEAMPADRWDRWAELQAHGIDLAVQPAEGRRKRLLLADMDSTMIRQECIDELAAEAGVGARVAAITARAMNGELDFEGP